MKVKASHLLVWFVALIICCSIIAVTPRYAMAQITGLLALYSFDENYGINALDSSGNDHHGTITMASRVSGKIGNGILFGADDARISIPGGLSFDNGLITIEAWVKPDRMESGEVYRIIGDYNYHGFYFQIRDGRLEILYEGQSYHYGTTQIPADAWTHIAFTSDGTNITTYVNASEDETSNITLPVQSIVNIHIGVHRIYTGGDTLTDYVEEFPGLVDEVRVWNIARTQSEIETDFDQQIISPPDVSFAKFDLVANYTFNESSGITVFDSSGNDHHGTITMASRVTGKIGNGILFGADDARIIIDDILSFNNGLITIEAWIKPNRMESGEIYRIIGGYNYYDFYFQIRDGRLEILYDGQSYHYGTTQIPVDAWTHIVFTSDGTNITTYINALEDKTSNITLPVQNLPNMYIGVHRIYTGGATLFDYIEEFPGIIDEMKIWNGGYPRPKSISATTLLLLMND